ncbi:MAG: hypothetical protein AB6733_12220 [Clostridiaceae bacterium]
MKARCIKGFSVEKCDDNGFVLPNKYYNINEGQVWEIDEDESNKFLGGEVRLVRDVKRGCSWMELPKEMFEEHFKLITTPCEIGHTVWITQKYCINDKKLWYGKVADFYKDENNEDVAELNCGLKPMECFCDCECKLSEFGKGVYLSRKEALKSLE